jgi:cytochrome c553
MRMLLLVLAACGPAIAPVAPAEPAGSDDDLPPMPPVGSNTMGWTTWSHEQKLAYMKTTVLPAERQIFQSFEPLRFAKMTCETCHGHGARDGTYKMPNPDLPHIDGGMRGFLELKTTQPEVLHFMQKVVGPQTAHLLGYAEFDMAQHIGFSCYQCHIRDGVSQ